MNTHRTLIWKEAGASAKAGAASSAEAEAHLNKKTKTKDTAERTWHGQRTG